MEKYKQLFGKTSLILRKVKFTQVSVQKLFLYRNISCEVVNILLS